MSGHERLFGEPPCDYQQGYEDGYFEKPLYEFGNYLKSSRAYHEYELGWEDGYNDRQLEKDESRTDSTI